MFKNFCEWDDSLSSTFCCSTSFSYTSMFFSVASLRRKTFMPLMQDCKSLPSSVTWPYHWNDAETQHSVVFPLRVWMIVLLLDDDVFLFCLWGLPLLNIGFMMFAVCDVALCDLIIIGLYSYVANAWLRLWKIVVIFFPVLGYWF